MHKNRLQSRPMTNMHRYVHRYIQINISRTKRCRIPIVRTRRSLCSRNNNRDKTDHNHTYTLAYRVLTNEAETNSSRQNSPLISLLGSCSLSNNNSRKSSSALRTTYTHMHTCTLHTLPRSRAKFMLVEFAAISSLWDLLACRANFSRLCNKNIY